MSGNPTLRGLLSSPKWGATYNCVDSMPWRGSDGGSATLTNLDTFQISRTALSCDGKGCVVSDWDRDVLDFTLTARFTDPGLATDELSANIGGKILKNGDSKNTWDVENVTFSFDRPPRTFTSYGPDSQPGASIRDEYFDRPDLKREREVSWAPSMAIAIAPAGEGSTPAFLVFQVIAFAGAIL